MINARACGPLAKLYSTVKTFADEKPSRRWLRSRYGATDLILDEHPEHSRNFGCASACAGTRTVHLEFLKTLGYASSSDRNTIPVLKAIGFLTDASVPTDLYRRYKDTNIARGVLAHGLRQGYADLFAIDPQIHARSNQELIGVFARLTGKGDAVSQKMATTFKTLAGLADFDTTPVEDTPPPKPKDEERPPPPPSDLDAQRQSQDEQPSGVLTLRHDIHVHLPLSSDVAVYDAIFKSLKATFL